MLFFSNKVGETKNFPVNNEYFVWKLLFHNYPLRLKMLDWPFEPGWGVEFCS
jgi:hypothetical protein